MVTLSSQVKPTQPSGDTTEDALYHNTRNVLRYAGRSGNGKNEDDDRRGFAQDSLFFFFTGLNIRAPTGSPVGLGHQTSDF